MRSAPTTEQQARYYEARAELRARSNAVKVLMQAGFYDSVNEGLLDMYTTDEHTDFATFWDWKKQGKSVIKGAKGFPIWGRPVEKPQADPSAQEDEETFWPLCYLFSNAQVK